MVSPHVRDDLWSLRGGHSAETGISCPEGFACLLGKACIQKAQPAAPAWKWTTQVLAEWSLHGPYSSEPCVCGSGRGGDRAEERIGEYCHGRWQPTAGGLRLQRRRSSLG